MSQIFNNTVQNAAATIFYLGGRFASGIVIARLLGPHATGEVTYLLWLADTLFLVTSLGIQSTLTRFSAVLRGQNRPELGESLCLYLVYRLIPTIFAGLLALSVYSTYKPIPNFPPLGWVILVIYYLSNGLLLVCGAYLIGQQDFIAWARISALASFTLVIGVLIGSAVAGRTGAVAGYAIANLIPSFVFVRRLFSIQKAPLPSGLKAEANKYSLYAWGAAILSAFVWSRAEILFLQHFSDSSQVGMYTVAITLSSLAAQGPLLLCGALMPKFAEQIGKAQGESLEVLYSVSTRLLAVVVLPICFVTAAFAEDLIPALYGENFATAIPTARILCVLAGIIGVMAPSTQRLYAAGHARFQLLCNIPFAVILAFGCWRFVPAFGSEGAAWVKAAIQISMHLFVYTYIISVLRFRFPISAVLRIVAASAFMSACVFWATRALPLVWSWPLIVALGGCGYFFLVMASKALSKNDLLLLTKAFGRYMKQTAKPLSIA